MSRRIAIPLSPRDRRVLRRGGWIVAGLLCVRLLMAGAEALDARLGAVTRERELLARELALLRHAGRDSALLDRARLALEATSPRLFDGTDAVTASAEMARYVSGLAVRSRLALLETETVLEDTAALRVVIRARGNVSGITDFLRAIESGPKLVRVETLGIGTQSDAGPVDAGALLFTATLTGSATLGSQP